jgi:hypothetical protein
MCPYRRDKHLALYVFLLHVLSSSFLQLAMYVTSAYVDGRSVLGGRSSGRCLLSSHGGGFCHGDHVV